MNPFRIGHTDLIPVESRKCDETRVNALVREQLLRWQRSSPLTVRIVAPHFVAGIERGGAVSPIIAYMRGWSLRQIRAYCARKHWQVEVL